MQAMTHGFNPDYHDDAPTLDTVRALRGPLLLEFGAPWCGHCQAAGDAIETAMAAWPTLPHIKVHDGKGKPLGRAFAVKLWPTLIVLNDGDELARCVRPTSADQLATLLQHITAATDDSADGASPVCYSKDFPDYNGLP